MGTIVERTNANGTITYKAQVIKKSAGRIVLRKAASFDKRAKAERWIREAEKVVAEPEQFRRARNSAATIRQAIEKYIEMTDGHLGRTKRQVLTALCKMPIGSLRCNDLTSQDITNLAASLRKTRSPATVAHYISGLGSVLKVAGAAFGFTVEIDQLMAARFALKELKAIGSSNKRDRRPSLEELDRLMTYFMERQEEEPDIIPMHKIVAFAIFSTRRQQEIVGLEWRDWSETNGVWLIRGMKDPRRRHNDMQCRIPQEAVEIARSMNNYIKPFPFNAESISARFTRACKFLGIEDLHFHDLRHDGISRLFEMGMDIPHVSLVSGHRSWSSLQRYTHIRQAGDKYAGWKWKSALQEG